MHIFSLNYNYFCNSFTTSEQPCINDFKKKVKLLNVFFSKQCSLILNNSSLPSDISYIINKRLSAVTFSAEDIGKVIQNLDSIIAHGHVNRSIRMLKMYGDSFCIL